MELHTETKIFCGCSTAFGAPPNTHTCPICLGIQGCLPVLNQQAAGICNESGYGLKLRDCHRKANLIAKTIFIRIHRKPIRSLNMITRLARNGWIEIEVNGDKKRIGITRLHLEEDAGKLTHVEGGVSSLVDFNRVGTPLVEIVSEPDLRSPEEATAYLEKLKAIMQYCEVSDV